MKILYYSGLPITSLTAPIAIKLTNHYHPNAKSSWDYLKDRPYLLYSSVFTYSPLANLLNPFLPSNTIFMQKKLKFTPIVTNYLIFTFQSCLTIINKWLTNNYLLLKPNNRVLMNFSPPNSSPTIIFQKMYLGHTLIPPYTTTKYLEIYINNKLIFDKHIPTLKASI